MFNVLKINQVTNYWLNLRLKMVNKSIVYVSTQTIKSFEVRGSVKKKKERKKKNTICSFEIMYLNFIKYFNIKVVAPKTISFYP